MANNKERREQSIEINKPLADEFVCNGFDSLNAFCSNRNISYISLYKYIKRDRPDINLTIKNNGKSKASVFEQRDRSKRPDINALDELYWKQGLTMAEIGEKYGVSAGSVCNWFDELGLKARDYVERVAMWMDDAHKEHFRKLANDGKIGVFRKKNEWQGNKTTWIEAELARWLEENNIIFLREFQIVKGSHRYDFWLKGTKLLLETDGLYFHNRDAQQIKDRTQEAFAKDYGFSVLRFTDKEIKSTNGKCFEVIRNELRLKEYK